jgi:hypothetical protein
LPAFSICTFIADPHPLDETLDEAKIQLDLKMKQGLFSRVLIINLFT